MKFNIIKILLSLLVLASFNAKACECSFIKSVEEELKNADLVLVGTVVNVTYVQVLKDKNGKATVLTSKSRDELDYFQAQVFAEITLNTSEVFKGKQIKKEVTIYTSSSGGGDCGYYFKLNEKYLVYAFKKEMWETKELEKNSDKYYTSICTRTKTRSTEEIGKLKLLIE